MYNICVLFSNTNIKPPITFIADKIVIKCRVSSFRFRLKRKCIILQYPYIRWLFAYCVYCLSDVNLSCSINCTGYLLEYNTRWTETVNKFLYDEPLFSNIYIFFLNLHFIRRALIHGWRFYANNKSLECNDKLFLVCL